MPNQEIVCDICGKSFWATNRCRKICTSCLIDQYRSQHEEPKPKKTSDSNERIMEAVRAATKLGMSYGEYKGRQK